MTVVTEFGNAVDDHDRRLPDWYEFSGLCLDLRVIDGPSPQRSAYLECLRANLSEAGFHALHVARMLWSYRPPFNVDVYVTYCHPPEVPMLIADMQALGATRWAAALIKGMQRKEPPEFGAGIQSDIESPEELQALIRKYVAAHQSELEDDIRRHGDPRRAKGFNRRKAQKAIEDRQDLLNLRRGQDEKVVELDARLRELADLHQAHGAQPTDKQVRHRMRTLVNQMRGDYTYHSKDKSAPPTDAMTRWLKDAKEFMDRNAELFAKKQPAIAYPASVQARLSAIGLYRVEERGRRIVWEDVAELKTDLPGFELVFEMNDDGRKPDLVPDEAMFESWQNYRKLHPTLTATYRKELIKHYRSWARSVAPDESDRYPKNLPEAEILAMVGGGQVAFRRTIWKRKPMYETAVTFEIEWDDEHGFGNLIVDGEGRVVDRE